MKTDGSNAIQKTMQKSSSAPASSMRNFIMKMSDQIKTALPANITGERMCRIAMTAISKNPKLAECTQNSFMGALLTSAQLGLECNTPLGQAYLIPFYNGKTKAMDCEFQLGYQGLIDLCYRTKLYKTIQARIVYEGDDFLYQYGMEEKLIHRPQEQSTTPIYVYAYYELINGAKSFEVMSWDSIMEYAKKYSMAVQKGYSSPWNTNPEEMAKKTLLKKVLKYAPKAVEVAEAVAQDSAIIKTNIVQDGGKTYLDKEILDVDITPAEPVAEEAPEENEHPAKVLTTTKKDAEKAGYGDDEQEAMDYAFQQQEAMYNDSEGLF